MKHLAVFAQGFYRLTNQGIQTTGASFAQVLQDRPNPFHPP